MLRLTTDRSGSFTMIFALSLVVLFLLAGMGIDYSIGLSFKSRWDTAADAAALAAVQNAQAYITANASTESDVTLMSGAVAAGTAAGLKSFNANAGTSEATETATPTITMALQQGQYTATVSYVGTVKTHFGGPVGVGSVSVSGASSAVAKTRTYLNYYIVVDTSQSMGIASTSTDESNLFALTAAIGAPLGINTGCVFGCHVPEPGLGYSFEDVAHNNGVTLRIDSAKTAVQDVIAQASTAAGGAGNIKIALYAMQLDPVNPSYLKQISALTNNYNELSSLATAIDLGENVQPGIGDTDPIDSLSKLTTYMSSNGTGLTADSPLNYVLIVTDGVVDTPTGAWCGDTDHCTSVIPTNACSTLKSNATVGVVYTTYLPIYTNNQQSQGYNLAYQALVLPFASQIAPNLQACASSQNLYFEASDGPTLISSLKQLFATTSAPLALIQ